MLLLTLAWRNLGRSRRRTALTLAAAVFATLLMILNLAVSAGSQRRWIANAVELYPGHFQVSARGYRDTHALDDALVLTPGQHAALHALPGGAGWAPRLESFGLVSADQDRATGRGVQLLGLDVARARALSRLLRGMNAGRTPARARDGGPREIVLGDLLARNLGAKLGDSVIAVSADAFGSQTADRFRVVGTFHLGSSELDGFAAILDLGELQDFLGVGAGVSHVAIFAPDLRAQPAIGVALAAAFPPDRFEIVAWPQLVPEVVQFFRIKDVGDWLKNGLLLIVVGFGLLNTILMSVFERVREFGVLRAIGMRPRAICGLVVMESLLLSLLGIVLGFALGIPLVLWLERNPIPLSGAELRASLAVFGLEPVLEFALSRSALVALPAVLFGVGLLAAFVPAVRASRSRPVDALREA